MGLRYPPDDAQTQAPQGAHPKSLILLRREVPCLTRWLGRQHARYLGCKKIIIFIIQTNRFKFLFLLNRLRVVKL